MCVYFIKRVETLSSRLFLYAGERCRLPQQLWEIAGTMWAQLEANSKPGNCLQDWPLSRC